MKLTQEERELVKAHIGEMLNGKSADNASADRLTTSRQSLTNPKFPTGSGWL